MSNVYYLVEKARKVLLSDNREETANFIGHMPFELIRPVYGDCETVDDILQMTDDLLEVKKLLDDLRSSRR